MEIQDSLFILKVAFFVDGNVRLHGGNAQGFGRGSRAKELPGTIGEREPNQSDGQVEVIVGSEFIASHFQAQAFADDDDHHIYHHDQKGETSHAGDVTNLNERDILVQGDSKAIPPKAGEDDSSQPFESRPTSRCECGNAQIIPGFQPDRLGLAGGLARFGDVAHEERPQCRIHSEIKAKCNPSGDCHCDQPVQAAQHVDNACSVTEQQRSEGVTTLPRWGEPEGAYERRQRKPAQPAKLRRRIAQREESAR